MKRRQFLVWAAAGGTALALGWKFAGRAASGGSAAALGERPFSWLELRQDGSAIVRVPFSEMGQGALTGIAQLVAEELDLPLERFTVRTAELSPEVLVGDMAITGGSATIQPLFDDWRRLGGTARLLLVEAAAATWRVPADRCRTDAGVVLHPDGQQRLAYGALAAHAARLSPPTNVPLKPRGEWKVIGTPQPRLEQSSLVDGSAVFGIDVKIPGLLSGAIAHCPAFGGTLRSVDASPALALPGVRQVVALPKAVAVVADTYWQAQRGLAALKPVWTRGKNPDLDDAALSRALEEGMREDPEVTLAGPEGVSAEARRAQVDAARRGGFERTYTGPLLAHATQEPQNATAVVAGDSAELWVPTQNQTGVQNQVASALNLPTRRVRVHTTLLGGGFGRRLKVDYAVEAALVARAVGRPVKLIWSREEDLQHDFYRPAARTTMSAAFRGDGRPQFLIVRNATMNDTMVGHLDGWYDLEAPFVESGPVGNAVPIGAWRSVDASLNAFFVECFVDELAERAGVDPLEYRLKLAAGKPRTRRVLEAAAERAGYGSPGRTFGVAAFAGWDTWLAQVAEVEAGADGRPRVVRITCAFDCGVAVNPTLVRQQVEGGILMGLSAALYEQVPLRDGRAAVTNFGDYRLLRFPEAPVVDVLLLETADAPAGGVGEPPVPPVAPAVANAFARLTGRRSRSLPLLGAARAAAG